MSTVNRNNGEIHPTREFVAEHVQWIIRSCFTNFQSAPWPKTNTKVVLRCWNISNKTRKAVQLRGK